jgi:hypothetical protein
MDKENKQYLSNYFESQSSFSYLNSERYFKDLKKLLDEPTKDRAGKLKVKIIKTLENDIKKVEKQMGTNEAKKIEDFFKLMLLKMIIGFFV